MKKWRASGCSVALLEAIAAQLGHKRISMAVNVDANFKPTMEEREERTEAT